MSVDRPGFADPVLDAQTSFRALLDAMARPGSVRRVAGPPDPPSPLMRATASVLLTLLDADTPLWADQSVEPALDWITFHTGAPIVAECGAARFAVAPSLPDLQDFDAGTDAGPEDAATVIVQVDAIGDGSDRVGRCFRLAGPGLRTPRLVSIAGLPDDFVARWQANHSLFPRGIDIILCAGDSLLALPRGITISEP